MRLAGGVSEALIGRNPFDSVKRLDLSNSRTGHQLLSIGEVLLPQPPRTHGSNHAVPTPLCAMALSRTLPCIVQRLAALRRSSSVARWTSTRLQWFDGRRCSCSVQHLGNRRHMSLFIPILGEFSKIGVISIYRVAGERGSSRSERCIQFWTCSYGVAMAVWFGNKPDADQQTATGSATCTECHDKVPRAFIDKRRCEQC